MLHLILYFHYPGIKRYPIVVVVDQRRDQQSSHAVNIEQKDHTHILPTMYMRILFFILLTSAYASCSEDRAEDAVPVKIPFRPCGGQVKEVRAYGCKEGKLPCVMHRGNTGRVEVDFIAPFDSRSLYADVRGNVGSGLVPVYIPLQGFHKEACIGHGITCPVKKGSTLTYHYEMLVDQGSPALQTDAIWKMTDFWGFNVACFRVDLRID